MATDSGRPPRLGRIMWALAAAAPFAGGAALWDWVRRHPVLFAAALLAYEVALVAANVLGQALGEAQKSWTASLGRAIDAAARRLVSRYGRRYRRFLTLIHHDVDLKGLATRGEYSLALNDVFVDVGLVPRPAHDAPASVVAAQPPQPKQGPQRRPVWEFLREAAAGHALVIIGPPGGGKTTLLKHITLVLAAGGHPARARGAPRHKVPILLYLREHAAAIAADPAVTLPSIAAAAMGRSGLAEPPGWFDRQLQAGRCVVLLDGLDEVARQEDRRVVIDWVERQLAAYAGNRFVLTSRPYGYAAHPLDRATVLQVRPFSPDQITRFVESWYLATERHATRRLDEGVRLAAREGAADLMSRLHDNAELLELAVNPLLLTMIANVHRYRGALPGSRVDLYREICQVLLSRRQEAKGLAQDLTVEQKEVVLRVLALHMMERETRDIATIEAADVIAPTLAAVRPQMDPLDFLTAVEQTSGLLLEREVGLHCFAHQTLQEYLAAAYILERGHTDLLLRNLGNGWWRETILMYAAQSDASRLVAACLDDPEWTVPKLALVDVLVQQARQLDPDLRRKVEDLPDQVGATKMNALFASRGVSRSLREVRRIRDELVVTRAPVTVHNYRLYMRAAGALDPDHWLSSRRPAWKEMQGPMAGMRGAAALAFADWATEIAPDGWTYRLPTPAEVGEIEEAGLVGEGLYGIWAAEGRNVSCRTPPLDPVRLSQQIMQVIYDDLTGGPNQPGHGTVVHRRVYMDRISLELPIPGGSLRAQVERDASPLSVRIGKVVLAVERANAHVYEEATGGPVELRTEFFPRHNHVDLAVLVARARILTSYGLRGWPVLEELANGLATFGRPGEPAGPEQARRLRLLALLGTLYAGSNRRLHSLLYSLALLELRARAELPATEVIMLVRE